MDMDRLKEFLIIAEAGSFKEASAILSVSPSVLSSRFSVFEESLGTKLLERNNRKICPTESGKILLGNAYDLVSSWETIKTSLKASKGTNINTLKVQLCARTMPSELGPFMDTYCRSHPGLFLDLYDENTCKIRDGLITRQTDIVFVPGFADDFIDMKGRVIISHYDYLSVHLPMDHRLSGCSSISFQELSGESFILYPEMLENHIKQLQISLLEKSGISYKLYDNRCSPLYYDLLVPIGMGVEFWNWSDMTTPNTTKVTIKDEGYDTYYYMLYDPDNPNPIVKEFIQLFLAYRKDRL
ncbi:MAG: LysR family transcriptional regulator [Butyrivibrio sp.]|nr:LysR family transcriptional regulator [Butyrivibrio sp.]